MHNLSFDQIRSRLNAAINDGRAERDRWVREIYPDRFVYFDEKMTEMYEAPYSIDSEGRVTVGLSRKVEMVYIAAKSSEVTAGAPREIQLIPYGRHSTDRGDFVLDEESAALVMAAHAGKQNDMVIDYEHQTLDGVEAPAAGWIKQLVNKGEDGIWAVVEWTERAAEYLANREYRYLSPVFLKSRKDNRVVRLVNAALTNQPAIDGMVALVNKAALGRKEQMEVSDMKELLKLLGLQPDATEEMAMKAVEALKAGAVLVAHKSVLAALGLEEDAKLDDVTAAVAAMKAEVDGMSALRKDLELAGDAPVSEVSGTVMAMKAGAGQEGETARRLAAIEAKQNRRAAEDLVAQAMKDGKVTPAQKDWALGYAEKDPDAFKVFVAKAPKVVPTGEFVQAGGGGPVPGGFDSHEDMVIAKQLGVTAEQRKKFGPKPGEEVA